jgi:hypothetical protein
MSKSILTSALAGTVAMLVFAGCEKKPADAKADQPTPAGEIAPEPASAEPETAISPPHEEPGAGGVAAAYSITDSRAPASSESPVNAESFATGAARVLDLPAGPERDAELGRFVRDSMHGGFERTEEWIGKMPVGETRDIAYSAFTEDLANVAPMLALDYASRISNPEKRAKVEATVRSSPRFASPPEPGQGVAPANPQPNPSGPDGSF